MVIEVVLQKVALAAPDPKPPPAPVLGLGAPLQLPMRSAPPPPPGPRPAPPREVLLVPPNVVCKPPRPPSKPAGPPRPGTPSSPLLPSPAVPVAAALPPLTLNVPEMTTSPVARITTGVLLALRTYVTVMPGGMFTDV